MSHWNDTIAYLSVMTEIVDIIIKHLFLTVITPHLVENGAAMTLTNFKS